MRRYVLAFLAVIIFAATAAYATTATGDPPKATSVVKVVLAKGHGSGVHIGNGYVLTAAHVVDSLTTAKIKLSDGKEVTGDVLWVNKAYDVALLRSDGGAMGVSKLACRTIAVGDVIRAAGNPTILEFVDSYGKVSGAKRELRPWKSVVITDITTVPGMSGGPVFDDKGEVVGISVGVLSLPLGFSASLTGFGTMVPSSTICELLARSS